MIETKSNIREWLLKDEKKGSFYLFKEKPFFGNKFLEALMTKRNKTFYLDDNFKLEGFVAQIYGVYEVLSLSKNFLKAQLDENNKQVKVLKKFPVDSQKALANDIRDIYLHIKEYGYDFEPVISNKTNEDFLRLKDDSGKQKYPYYGCMTWILSLSTLLWKIYFVDYDIENDSFENVKPVNANDEIISDPECVKIIYSVRKEIMNSIKDICYEFVNNYISESKNEEGIKKGWGYTRDCTQPSLYFTYSVLESYNDLDSNIFIGGDDDFYFRPSSMSIEDQKLCEANGIQDTKPVDSYDVNARRVENIIDYINEGITNEDDRIEVRFRKQATEVSYYLFKKFKNSIMTSFYNDNGLIITKEQIYISSSTSALFYPLYLLSSFLYGEVNNYINTKTARAQFLALKSPFERKTYIDSWYELDLVEDNYLTAKNNDELEDLVSLYLKEYKELENCFIEGLNNVQKVYDYMIEKNAEGVVDRHYLTFDQQVTTEPIFSKIFVRENIMVGSILPLLVNVTNLYVSWVTKYPEKQLAKYAMDIFEKMCNRNKNGELEWLFEQNRYDLHITIRYMDAIANFLSYYDEYERDKAKAKDLKELLRNELKVQFDGKLQQKIDDFEKERKELLREKNEIEEKYKQQMEEKQNENDLKFNFNNVVMKELSEIFSSYLESNGSNSEYKEYIDSFVETLFKVLILKLSGNIEDVEDFEQGIKYIFEKKHQLNKDKISKVYIQAVFANLFNNNNFVDPKKPMNHSSLSFDSTKNNKGE